ncbi:hypothetical protein B1222_12830 [Paenibacillus larvae subsp. pulvifaciens]|nr:hypothetical protein B1222_12830 [Paenibacillus larvae subsp. pulvifaciens]AQZ47076.1 hypothetical protein B5S25_11245 [Paenibacillus larvae subsp. pulvifaciens]MBH0341658.1 hypothetical protein [Paenibacillus larvae]
MEGGAGFCRFVPGFVYAPLALLPANQVCAADTMQVVSREPVTSAEARPITSFEARRSDKGRL